MLLLCLSAFGVLFVVYRENGKPMVSISNINQSAYLTTQYEHYFRGTSREWAVSMMTDCENLGLFALHRTFETDVKK